MVTYPEGPATPGLSTSPHKWISRWQLVALTSVTSAPCIASARKTSMSRTRSLTPEVASSIISFLRSPSFFFFVEGGAGADAPNSALALPLP